MTYRNAKTGALITTTGKVSGKNWVPMEDPPVDPPVAPPVDPPVAPPKEKSAKKGKQ